MYRVMMKTVDEFGQESFCKYGPLRKSLGTAVSAADRVEGYVVNLNTGNRVYQAPACLKVREMRREKRNRVEFSFAQMFQTA